MPEAAGQDPDKIGTQEAPSVDVRTIVWVGASFAAMVVFCVAAVALFYWWRLGVLPTVGPRLPEPTDFPEPRLQVRPPGDLAKMRHEEHEKLNARAALPIDRAMAAVAGRKSDAFAPLVPPKPATVEAKP